MKRRGKTAVLLLMLAALAIALAACTETVPKHPLVAKWTEQFDEGKTQVTFSFEAIGDAEIYVWRYDEEVDKLVQTEYYWGEYTADDENGVVSLSLRTDAKESYEAAFSFVVAEDGQMLTLKNDEYDLELKRAAENSARVK